MIRTCCRPMVAVALAAVVAWTAPAAIAAQAGGAPDLTGTWVLNTDLSDRPGQGAGGSDRDGGGRRGPGGGGGGMGRPGRGMGGRGGGFGGRGGDMPDREDMERMRAAMDAAMRAAKRLIIVKGEAGLIVTDDEGVSTRLALDGRKETGAINGAPFESTTKWDAGKLRVEKKFKGGLKVVEIYSVSVEPRLLTVSSSLDGGGRRAGGRTVTRVYDAEAR